MGRDDTDLGDLVIVVDGLGPRLEFGNHGSDGEIDTALEIHRIDARRNRFHAFANDRLREHRRGRSAVTRMVVGFGRDSLAHLRAHILELVFRSEEHTSELQSLMRISYAVFCLKKKKIRHTIAVDNILTLY